MSAATSAVSRRASRWIRCSGPADPRVRVVCLPYAGSSASLYRGWQLPERLDAGFLAIQLPGREERIGEPPFRRIQPLVEALEEQLRPFLDRPYVVVGHSMGAIVGYELALLQRQRGGPMPINLVVSAHRAPHLPDPHPPVSDLPDPQLFAWMDRLAGPSRTVMRDPGLLAVLGGTIRADFEFCEHYEYRPEAPLNIPITAFAATDDDYVSVAEVRAWDRHTDRGCRTVLTSGGHLFIRERAEHMLAALAELVGQPDGGEGTAA